MRVIVCGGRNYSRREFLFAALDAIHAATPITLVIHGAASGADTLGREWARWHGVPAEAYAADWKKYGLSAGPKRNARMLAEGKPELVVAFPGGSGTADMVRKAIAAGVPVRHPALEREAPCESESSR